MIELFAADTPNGKKISIMLEEVKTDYKITPINLSNKEQFNAEFKKISPFNKIPVITDHETKQSIFESGAILIYLADKYKILYDKSYKIEIDQWLMAQMGLIGPLIGQHHQFHHYNPGISKFGEERYFNITKKLYEDLDLRLGISKFLASEHYSIADIATWPWIARHEWHDIGLKKYNNLSRWYNTISERDAVIKGYNFMGAGQIPKP
ncbi:MAG: glutathione S-transferase [Candidatus Pelagibacter sp. TMED275]|nr:MAG: glutathione S-transferase [Candidatus Pelagibacter sp. TMED275]